MLDLFAIVRIFPGVERFSTCLKDAIRKIKTFSYNMFILFLILDEQNQSSLVLTLCKLVWILIEFNSF